MIYVMRANGSGRRRLTATASDNEIQPTWSPNGLWIAYAARRGIYIMRPNGRSPRLVGAKGWQPSWAPKSNSLVYSRQTARWDGLVYRVDINGKHKKQLLHPRLDASPKWSSDGTRLAFSRDGVIYEVNADGSGLLSIGLSGSDPAWSPDNNLIVVASGLDLVVAGSDGSAPSALHLALDPTDFTSVSDPDWSPDGTKIVFVATEISGTRDLFVVSPYGGFLKRLPLECGSTGASSPTWSPSGVFLGLSCDQSIAVVYADGSNLVPIGEGLDSTLAWSPDGSQIVLSEQPVGPTRRALRHELGRDGARSTRHGPRSQRSARLAADPDQLAFESLSGPGTGACPPKGLPARRGGGSDRVGQNTETGKLNR